MAGYRAGGIDCRDIKGFDKWLSRQENYERILPFPRTIAAFRVRRYDKEREWDGSIAGLLFNFSLEQADKTTFLYVRNGKQLWRLNTAIDFGTCLFPDKEEFNLDGKTWALISFGKIEAFISDREYQAKVREESEQKRKHDEWMAQHKDDDNAWYDCPYRDTCQRLEDWEPFDQSSVYYDDILKNIAQQIESYNRIALIVQGLFDRSLVLHPHPPARLYSPQGFAAAVELVYDAALVIHSGDAPDFEIYRAACNRSLRAGSVTIGQDDFWQRQEAVKEINRRRSDWRHKMSDHDYLLTHYAPYGNPGPGLLSPVAEWQPRAKRAVYRWHRERQRYNRWGENNPLPDSIRVPAAALLNIDAYQSGDFKKFYADYRTRLVYLKWAPLLLAAEEYHAGNLQVKTKCE